LIALCGVDTQWAEKTLIFKFTAPEFTKISNVGENIYNETVILPRLIPFFSNAAMLRAREEPRITYRDPHTMAP
jgi:hypothetical protein